MRKPRNDLTGQVFGRLTVLGIDESATNELKWICRCECGGTQSATTGNLVGGRVQSCGCLRKESRAIDLTGQVFGRLIVTGRKKTKPGVAVWTCRCACGRTSDVSANSLLARKTRSCGVCTRGTHHLSDTPEFDAWKVMRQRCRDPKATGYKNYGGRGITVCERWESFENFIADMGPRPFEGASIDRIDTDGDYTPENCRWATRIEQANNKRSCHRLTLDGKTQTIAEWAREAGLNYVTLFYRLRERNFELTHHMLRPVERRHS